MGEAEERRSGGGEGGAYTGTLSGRNSLVAGCSQEAKL